MKIVGSVKTIYICKGISLKILTGISFVLLWYAYIGSTGTIRGDFIGNTWCIQYSTSLAQLHCSQTFCCVSPGISSRLHYKSSFSTGLQLTVIWKSEVDWPFHAIPLCDLSCPGICDNIKSASYVKMSVTISSCINGINSHRNIHNRSVRSSPRQ